MVARVQFTTENLPLSPRQKICSTVVKTSIEVHRETKALLPVRKRETIGQLCSNPAAGLETKITSGLLENRLEPQATYAQESFIAPILAIDILSMPMMNTHRSRWSRFLKRLHSIRHPRLFVS